MYVHHLKASRTEIQVRYTVGQTRKPLRAKHVIIKDMCDKILEAGALVFRFSFNQEMHINVEIVGHLGLALSQNMFPRQSNKYQEVSHSRSNR